jgi:hypothetical protein
MVASTLGSKRVLFLFSFQTRSLLEKIEQRVCCMVSLDLTSRGTAPAAAHERPERLAPY